MTKIRWRIRRMFEHKKTLTSPVATKKELEKGYLWLEKFEKARAGDVHLQAVLQRYSRMIAAKQQKADFIAAYRKEMEWQERLRNRPILTGSYLRPTLYNPPLPRLKPQPIHVTGMIVWRKKARMRRFSLRELLWDWRDDLQRENKFELMLAEEVKNRGEKGFERVFGHQDWMGHIQERLDTIQKYFVDDDKRRKLPYPPTMLEQIKQARREKNVNKLREYTRERRGEVLKRTIRRARRGPPAHVLCLMSEEEKRLDRISRSTSEVGYVAQAKMKLGWKMKDPERWKLEGGKEENLEWVRRLETKVREANERKRRKAEAEEAEKALERQKKVELTEA
ncbi:unnamed protein product [Somion occarium]|uniref:Uncharacterized protein n=1 Tax=Somion occarium TaxID=3059160 RepID=A0ABP1DY24_9APHY